MTPILELIEKMSRHDCEPLRSKYRKELVAAVKELETERDAARAEVAELHQNQARNLQTLEGNRTTIDQLRAEVESYPMREVRLLRKEKFDLIVQRDTLQARLAELEKPQVEPIPDCGEAGHADGCCGNAQCLPSYRKRLAQQTQQLRKFLYYVDGLPVKEHWVAAATAKEGAEKLWQSLTDNQRDTVRGIEWIDEEPAQRLTDEEVAEIVREASKGSAIRRDGTTSQRISRAVETAFCRKNGIELVD